MTSRELMQAALRGESAPRLPCIEWATWWDKTVLRWEDEGMPRGMSGAQRKEYFGLDVDHQHWVRALPDFEEKGKPIRSMEDFTRARANFDARALFDRLRPALEETARRQQDGDIAWITFDGFFWFPRRLFGIEAHLFAFYDQPELMHEMNAFLRDFQLQLLDVVCEHFTPDFMTFGEDMSYNLGPMLSEECFDEFLLPSYRSVIPELEKRSICPIVDTDGDLTRMIPWLRRAGIRGALPLERQAGVDLSRIQRDHPGFFLLGGFDKMTMFAPDAPGAMRAEFDRILPAMRAGSYVPSVDHQTPPHVSLQNYRVYLSLLRRAVQM